MDSTDIITALVALYAALLATAVAVYSAVSGWRARRANIRVEIYDAFYL